MWERLLAAWGTPNAPRTRVDDLWVWGSIATVVILGSVCLMGFAVWWERRQEEGRLAGIRHAGEVNDDQRDGSN